MSTFLAGWHPSAMDGARVPDGHPLHLHHTLSMGVTMWLSELAGVCSSLGFVSRRSVHTLVGANRRRVLQCATRTDTAHQAVTVGIISACKQAPAFKTVGVRLIGSRTRGHMPGQRTGRSRRIKLALGPHHDTPSEAGCGNNDGHVCRPCEPEWLSMPSFTAGRGGGVKNRCTSSETGASSMWTRSITTVAIVSESNPERDGTPPNARQTLIDRERFRY
jgi:hypothetical protein